jgi:hypothetical protein
MSTENNVNNFLASSTDLDSNEVPKQQNEIKKHRFS